MDVHLYGAVAVLFLIGLAQRVKRLLSKALHPFHLACAVLQIYPHSTMKYADLRRRRWQMNMWDKHGTVWNTIHHNIWAEREYYRVVNSVAFVIIIASWRKANVSAWGTPWCEVNVNIIQNAERSPYLAQLLYHACMTAHGAPKCLLAWSRYRSVTVGSLVSTWVVRHCDLFIIFFIATTLLLGGLRSRFLQWKSCGLTQCLIVGLML